MCAVIYCDYRHNDNRNCVSYSRNSLHNRSHIVQYSARCAQFVCWFENGAHCCGAPHHRVPGIIFFRRHRRCRRCRRRLLRGYFHSIHRM